MEDSASSRLDVAPLISDAKASQAWRRFLSTVCGGGRILPGMTWKIYLFQALLWFLPVLFSGLLAFGLDNPSSWPYLRLMLGAALNLAYGLALELLHAAVSRCGAKAAAGGTANRWFMDNEEVDFKSLLTPQVMDILLPRRSLPWALGHLALSALLGAVTAQVLAPRVLRDALQLDPTSADVVSCWVFLTAGMAHLGLHAQPAPEVSLSSTESRCWLVLALLLPQLADLTVELARGLLVTVALLPLLWSVGLLPSLFDLVLWGLEQVELHLFGGSQLLTLPLSLLSSVGISWAGRYFQADKLVEILLAAMCLCTSAWLTIMAPLDDWKKPRCNWRMGGVLQVLVAAGLLVPCTMASPSELLLLRLAMEQVALLLTLLAVYVIGHWQLSVRCCGGRNGNYLRHRQKLLWDDQGGPKDYGDAVPVSEQLVEVTDSTLAFSLETGSKHLRLLRVARHVETVELLARILLLLHMSFFGTMDLNRGDLPPLSFFVLVALQLRQLRLSFADCPRAALDAAVAGLLQVGFQLASSQTGSPPPVAVQICLVSVIRQRAVALWGMIRYVVHLSWITWATPKLRHPVTPLLLWLNVLFWPGLLVLLLLCALLETPLMAIFSLPLFSLAAPRWSKSGADAPLVKGAEGLFYSIAAPSLLRGLALQWRAQTLSRAVGTLLFCRSHERLACVVRVLASGFGWVQLELRGLELQEPTSCHHVEAGKIDEVFAHAFEGQRAPDRQSFVLQPICEVTCSTYEQSLISLRGLLDNPQLLQQMHGLFLKSLVWVLMSVEQIPAGWLTCPLKPQDVKEVRERLSRWTWPKDVARALQLDPQAHPECSDLRRATAASVEAAPRPPPGTPPVIRPPHKAVSEVPLPSAAPATVSTVERSNSLLPGEVEDLDSLMDQVLGMAPHDVPQRPSRGAAPARQAARRLLGTDESRDTRARGDEAWSKGPAEEAWGKVMERPQVTLASLGTTSEELQPVERSLSQPKAKPEEELSPLLRLVIEAYVAVNVAPLFGQKPEAHGTSHVLRLFSGTLGDRSQETAELKWLVERPELLQLTLTAFRCAVKISIDAAAMGEEVDMEYQSFSELVQDLSRRWFLGVEGSLQWEAAMKRGWPNLMALRSGKGVSEVQVLRLRYCEDICRVGELRQGVWSSLWASAALELRYFANDDDERYSIQAHPTLFRNMAVQCAEYPIYVSRISLRF